jgi:8-oxo-dGTP pyrophosphatase MutT (NUDIX family)
MKTESQAQSSASTADAHFEKREHELIARGVIVENSRLLVNRSRNKKTGESYCALPGGHIDPGENSKMAVQREIIEELGCATRVGDLLFVTESIYAGRHENDGRRHEIVLYFQAELLEFPQAEADGRLKSPEDDKNFAWLPLEQLPIANLLPTGTQDFLTRYAATLSSPSDDSSDNHDTPIYFFHDATKTSRRD